MEHKDSKLKSAFFYLATFVIIIAGLKSASSIVVLILAALFIALLFFPLLSWMQSKNIPLLLIITSILCIFVFLSYFIIWFLDISINNFINDLPEYQERLRQGLFALNQIPLFTRLNIPSPEALFTMIAQYSLAFTGDVFRNITSFISRSFIVLLATMFILIEAASLPKKLKQVALDPEHHAAASKYAQAVIKSINEYILMKTMFSIITGVLIAIILSILGVKYATLWGMLAFILNYIPSVGSIIASIPPILITLIDGSFSIVGLVILAYLAVNVSIGSIIEPKITGSKLGLSILVVFISLIFWGWVFGTIGMFLSIPLTMLVKISLSHNPKTKWIATLLS